MKPVAQTHRPRVLIVEPNGDLALATVRACLDAGLEPKLCSGAEHNEECPGLSGKPCARSQGVEATLVTIETGVARRAAPSCIGGRVVVAGERPLVGRATIGVLAPDARLEYPYRPEVAAEMLLQIVRDAHKERAWNLIRGANPVS